MTHLHEMDCSAAEASTTSQCSAAETTTNIIRQTTATEESHSGSLNVVECGYQRSCATRESTSPVITEDGSAAKAADQGDITSAGNSEGDVVEHIINTVCKRHMPPSSSQLAPNVPPQSPTTPIPKRTCNTVFDFSPQPNEASEIIRMDKENAQDYENAKQAIVGDSTDLSTTVSAAQASIQTERQHSVEARYSQLKMEYEVKKSEIDVVVSTKQKDVLEAQYTLIDEAMQKITAITEAHDMKKNTYHTELEFMQSRLKDSQEQLNTLCSAYANKIVPSSVMASIRNQERDITKLAAELHYKEIEHSKRLNTSFQLTKKQEEQTWLSVLPSLKQIRREFDVFVVDSAAELDVYREPFRKVSVEKYNYLKLLKACPKNDDFYDDLELPRPKSPASSVIESTSAASTEVDLLNDEETA